LHRFLTIAGHGEWISVRFYIEHLCEALVEAVLKPVGVRCEVSADDGIYPSERCELLGLIIAELVTNAAKHAFRERDDGLLRVEFTNNPVSWVCVVSDNGVGSPAMSSGVGYRILQPLLRALDASSIRKSGSGGISIAIAGQM
jgi:two-component sensor histidine kinase